MSTTPTSADDLHHHSRRMGGRDRHERHRVATPLELLFDLTFVVSFGLAASQLAHALAESHYGSALLGYGFASFAICVGVFLGLIYSLYYYLVRQFDPFHVWLLIATAAVVAVAVTAALSGVSMAVCLVILVLAPAVTVVGYEVRGCRHQAESLLS